MGSVIISRDSTLDAVKASLNALPTNFQDTQRQERYTMCNVFINEAKKTAGINGGVEIEKHIRVRPNTNARMSRADDDLPANLQNYSVVTSYQRATASQIMLLTDDETATNRGEERIVDVVAEKRSAAYEGLYNLLEDQLTQPASTSTVQNQFTSPLNYLCSIVSGSTDYIGSFSGYQTIFGDATTSTFLGRSIDRSLAANSRTKNWAFTRKAADYNTLVDQIRYARQRTDFHSLPQLLGMKPDAKPTKYILASPADTDGLIKLLNQGPDDKEGDLVRFQTAQIAGVMVVPVPTWDGLSYQPVVGVNTNKIYFAPINGFWFKEYGAVRNPMNMRQIRNQMECWGQLVAEDIRSAGWIGTLPR